MNTTTEPSVKVQILHIDPRPSATACITDEQFQKWLRNLAAVPISAERKLELEKAGVWRDKNFQSDL